MTTIELLSVDKTDWQHIAEDPTLFAAKRQVALGIAGDVLRSVATQCLALFDRTGVTGEPWSGYLAVDRARATIVGTCGVKAPPDADGMVEIAYFTFPEFEGCGIASAMATQLIERTGSAAGVRLLRAHTLPERNASTRILEKHGFRSLGAIVDPEDGLVWRWEREPSRMS